MQWRHSSYPKAKMFKQASSVRKIMATVFWDRKGILLIDFLQRGLTINVDIYCETVRKLRRTIQNKRRGMLSGGIVLLHENTRNHTTDRTASTVATISLGSFWPAALDPRSLTKRIPHIHASKEMACIPNALKTTIDWRQALPHGLSRWRRTSLTLEKGSWCHDTKNVWRSEGTMWKNKVNK